MYMHVSRVITVKDMYCNDVSIIQEICLRLWCQNGTSCTTKNSPPADGTSCGSTNVRMLLIYSKDIDFMVHNLLYVNRFVYKGNALMAAAW